MIAGLKTKGLLWPLLLTIIGLVILISLGNWQMKRRVFKAELIEKVEERLKAAPLSIEVIKARAKLGEDLEYQPVQVEGEFYHDKEVHYFLPLGSSVGWHIITPLKLSNGDVVFIDRGFVEDALKVQKTRLEGLPAGSLSFTGLVRGFEQQGFFTPDNDIAANKWYWRDQAGLYNQLGAYNGARLPFMIDAGRDAQTGKWPKAGVTRVKFNDKHLGYAMTWYGLALTLIGVFSVFAIQRWRS